MTFTVAPEGFEVVITTLSRLKDVHDQFAVIEESPAAFIHTFFPERKTPRDLFKLVLHGSGNGSHLHIGMPASDHHPVRQAGHFVHADQFDPGGFPVVTGVSSELSELLAVEILECDFSHKRFHW